MQAWLSVIGAVMFPVGIAAIQTGGPAYEPVVVVGSLIVFVGAALFAFIVFRDGAPVTP
jgi:NO-binding membrane sensor protein with MHYT domain